jgi:hypothetical protein
MKHFLRTSQKTTKYQICSAVCTYVLIAIPEIELQLNNSLYTCPRNLSICIFERNELSCAFQSNDYTTKIQDNPNQLVLIQKLTG